MLAVGAFIGVDILKSKRMTMEQVQDSLRYMSENCADEFSAIFDNADLIVDNMVAVAEENLEQDLLESVTYDMAMNSNYPISIYYVLNPDKFNFDVWYVKGMDGKVVDLSISDAEMEQWLFEYNEEKLEYIEFYNEVINEGDMWYETMYDPDIKWEIVTRTRVIRDDSGEIIGIAAADVYLGDISEKLFAIDEKTGGVSAVTHVDGSLVAGDIDAIDKSKSEKYLSATSRINNRWMVTVVQPASVATKTVRSTIFITLFLGLLVIIAFAVTIMLLYRKHGMPIIREFEEKDVLIINQSRQAQMGEMVGNIAHQLKQPLNGVNMALSNLQEDYVDYIEENERNVFIERIVLMKKRISTMSTTVDDFIEFLRPQKEKTVFSVRDEIQSMIELMEESIHIDMIETTITGADFHVEGHKNEFGQCIFNIIDNARDAMKDLKEKKITVVLSTEKDARGRTYGYITISNKGSYIDEEIIDNVFELYFTTKEKIGGTGIGLYLTKSIIEKHFDGKMRCFNYEDGVSFEMCIPLNKEDINDGNAC